MAVIVWAFLALILFAIFWGMGAARERRRAENRLNNQGLPKPVSRDDHRYNDEE